MTAVWYRFRAELRSRWRAWLGLGLLVGLAAGAVMALVAGARRTDSAYSRFLEANNAYDVMIMDWGPPNFAGLGGFDGIAALPSVEDSAEGDLVYPIPVGDPGVAGIASEDDRIDSDINTLKILEGRRADPERPDEVLVSFAAAEEHDLDVGSTIQLLPPDDVDRIADPDELAAAHRFLDQAPNGRLRVVGIEAAPGEFPPQHYIDAPVMHLTPAFHDLHFLYDSRVLLVRLREGAEAVSGFDADLDRVAEDPTYKLVAQADNAIAVERSIHLQTVALWLLAGLLAASTILIVGQLLSRLARVEAQDHPTLGALGMSGRGRALLGVIRATGIAAAGAFVGVVVAVAASPLLPTGLARTADPDLGVHLDAVVLGLGATATVAVVMALGAWASWRAASASTRVSGGVEHDAVRPSGVARVVALGAWPLAGKVGVHMALEPDRGRSAVPVRTTLTAVTLGVSALVAALTFGASLTHLLDSPRLYGLVWDVQLQGYTDADIIDQTFVERGMPLRRPS